MAQRGSWRLHSQTCFVTIPADCFRTAVDSSMHRLFLFWIRFSGSKSGHQSCGVGLCFSREGSQCRLSAVLVVFQTNDFIICSLYLRTEVLMSSLGIENIGQAMQIKSV